VKILFVIPYYAPAWAYGGPPKVMDELARHLVARGHTVTVYTTDAYDGSRRMEMIHEERGGASVRRFRNLSNALAYRQKIFVPLGFANALGRTVGQFDVIHLSDFRTVQNAQTLGIARRGGVPYVLSAFGQLPRATGIKRTIKRGYDLRYGRALLRSAGALIAQTENEAAWYRRLGADPARVRIVPLAIDTEAPASPSSGAIFRARHGIPPAAPIVLFLGRFHAYKGLDLLIRAFAAVLPHVPDACLVLVGRDDGYEATARALAASLGIAGSVIWPGPLYERDKLAAYTAADVFAFTPSHEEETSTAVLEGLACGTPAIVTHQSEVPWLDAYNAGMTIEYDRTALRDAIVALLSDRPRLAAMRKNTRRLIADHFTWGSVIEDIETIYAEVVGRTSPT
jgi:glycosyltransferase involved in cell wall biosynthesis